MKTVIITYQQSGSFLKISSHRDVLVHWLPPFLTRSGLDEPIKAETEGKKGTKASAKCAWLLIVVLASMNFSLLFLAFIKTVLSTLEPCVTFKKVSFEGFCNSRPCKLSSSSSCCPSACGPTACSSPLGTAHTWRWLCSSINHPKGEKGRKY